MIAEAEDGYVLCWNAEGLRKRERWPAYRDRPEIWDHAGREDFEAMLEVLTALGAVQYRADGWEADEALAALVHRLEGTERLVIRSDDKDFMQLLSGSTWMEGRVRGQVREWIDRDLRVAPAVKRAIEENREQLRLNLALVDLSADAVGEPPPPRLEGWGDLDRATAIGRRTGIAWLEEPAGPDWAVLRSWGARARERLDL